MDIKEESGFLDFCSGNESDTKIFIKNIKSETSDSDTKPQFEEDFSCYSQHHVMRFNETIKESAIETKIDIKEEHWLLKREDSCVHDDIKNETHEDFYSTKPPSLWKDVSNYTSDLSSTEDLEDDASFNMNMYNPEWGSDRKCQGQERVVADVCSIETRVCSETSVDGENVCMVSCLKHSNLLQQCNTNKQDINMENCNSILSHEYRQCDVSKKGFKHSSHLEKCMDTKRVNRCDALKKDLNHLPLKTNKVTDEGTKTHKCNICNASFTCLQHLTTHKVNHEGIQPNRCHICNKDFTRSSGLKRHQLLHEGIKPYKCDTCDKAFSRLSNLKTHKLIHQGIKPHKCNICNKAFTKSSGLKDHKLIHEGVKPHKCNICNRAFTLSSYLKSHKLTHEGIRPYKCSTCDKAFTQLSALKTHKSIHDRLQPHKCDHCSKSFAALSSLKRHRLSHEGINSQV